MSSNGPTEIVIISDSDEDEPLAPPTNKRVKHAKREHAYHISILDDDDDVEVREIGGNADLEPDPNCFEVIEVQPKERVVPDVVGSASMDIDEDFCVVAAVRGINPLVREHEISPS